MRRAYVADFEQVAREYAERVARDNGRRLAWFDIHGKHEHLAERPQYDKFKVDVHVDSVHYGTVSKTVDRPGYVYTQWFHNDQQSEPVKGVLEKTVQRQTSFTWSVQEGITVGAEVTMEAGVPGEFSVGVSVNAEISLQATQSHTTTDTETFTISNTITIDPQTSTRAEWIINEREMEIPWEATVHIDGWVALWLEPQLDGHWLWFHPVPFLATGPFVRDGQDGLAYRASGVFRGVRGFESVLRTYDYPLQTGTYALPSSLSPRGVTVVERKTLPVGGNGGAIRHGE